MERLRRVLGHVATDSTPLWVSRRNVAGGGKGVALVVGAGTATGGSVAAAFAREGYHAVVVRRNGDKLKPLVQRIRSEGGSVTPFGVDCRKEDAVDAMVARIEAEIGPIEICVHNIGANVRFSILETTARVYRKVWEMAALSAFLVCRASARRMVSRNRGTIIITGATASLRGKSHFAAFAGAKNAKRALAQSMARELMPRGIHVAHVVIDGPIDTPWIRNQILGPKVAQQAADKDALLRPDEIAKTYVALHQQHRSAWSHEVDLRPWLEKW